MVETSRGLKAVATYLEMIKFEHSIFALPFAFIGLVLGSVDRFHQLLPSGSAVLWVVIAMVSCRSAAMAFNRLIDRSIDAKNSRTSSRALPAGKLHVEQVWLFFLFSCLLFFFASYSLNMLAFLLSPVALGTTLFYSYTKRFTWLCHFILGLSLGIAPAAAWIAVQGTLSTVVLPVVAGVMLWTAGFDIIYALQDETFDKQERLHSIPERFGVRRALVISRISHIGAVIMFLVAGYLTQSSGFYYCGVFAVTGLLVYEQSLVKADDLSKVNLAFFTLNGFISMLMLGVVLIAKWVELRSS